MSQRWASSLCSKSRFAHFASLQLWARDSPGRSFDKGVWVSGWSLSAVLLDPLASSPMYTHSSSLGVIYCLYHTPFILFPYPVSYNLPSLIFKEKTKVASYLFGFEASWIKKNWWWRQGICGLLNHEFSILSVNRECADRLRCVMGRKEGKRMREWVGGWVWMWADLGGDDERERKRMKGEGKGGKGRAGIVSIT